MLSTSSAQQLTPSTMNRVDHAQNGHAVGDDSVSTMDVKRQFDAAVNVIRNLPATPSKDAPFQPSDALRLRFYAYFKQATEGPNNTPKPAFYDLVGKYKWTAWKDLGNMSKLEAMKGYVNELKQIVETMSLTQPVADFYEVLGPFYEFVTLPEKKSPDTKSVLDDSPSPLTGVVNGKVPTVTASSTRMPLSHASGDHKQEAIRAPGKMNGYVNGTDCNEFELSDNEEFSDSYDSLSNGLSDSHGANQIVTDEIISARGETQLTPPRFTGGCVSNRPTATTEPNARGIITQGTNPSASSSGSTGGGNGHSTSRSNIPEVNEQIAIAILRLQQSMEQVCNRLDSLETRLRTSQSDQSSVVQAHSKGKKKSNWWPLENMSTSTTVFLIVWPLLAHYLMDRIKNRPRN